MLKVEIKNNICVLTLNRPEVKNALNSELIDSLIANLEDLKINNPIRVIVITGSGDCFCSGADLKWLGDVAHYSYQENYEESMKFIDLLNLINTHPKPIIAKVNGIAVGGGVGIMLASDIIIADNKASFGVSEVAIGIVPAAIVHFLINRIGETKAREYLLTGNRIDAKEAEKIGLINYALETSEIDEKVNKFCDRLINNGPKAISKAKEMINKLPQLNHQDSNNYIAEVIAKLRTSKEGQEGITSFLEKRRPKWDI